MRLVEKVESYTIELSKEELETIVAVIGATSLKGLEEGFGMIFGKKPSITTLQFNVLYSNFKDLIL